METYYEQICKLLPYNGLPKRWIVLGKILILKIPHNLQRYAKKIAEVYTKVLKVSTVVKPVGKISGIYREPNFQVIYGTETETIHIENKIKYKFDVTKIMFSPGNIHERIRMANISNKNEVVVDMFAGIGYFTLQISVHSKLKVIYAYEINPFAYKYLQENILLNKTYNVIPKFMDCLLANEQADRIIIGYLKDSYKYLEKAYELINPNGIIHFHTNTPNVLLTNLPNQVTQIAQNYNRKIKILNFLKIKSYAPGVTHVVLDIKCL